MAKNNSLGDAIQKIINNAENAAAMSSVILKNQIKKDFEKAARDAVDKYYEYQNGAYTKHGRQYRLYDIYTVSADTTRKGKGYTIDVAITMDSDILNGVYHSKSSKHSGNKPWEEGGDVEAEYVFKNFLSGAHPWTNGWPVSGEDELRYKLLNKTKPSPEQILNNYLKSYDKYLNKHFHETLTGLIKLYS